LDAWLKEKELSLTKKVYTNDSTCLWVGRNRKEAFGFEKVSWLDYGKTKGRTPDSSIRVWRTEGESSWSWDCTDLLNN
jgi:hypothetical protein